MIEAELADGRILEFPDGTDPAVIQGAVKKMVGATPPPKVQQPPQEEGVARTALEQGLQGATFGFSDDVINPLAALGATLFKDPQAILSGEFEDEALAQEIAGLPEGTKARFQRQFEQNPVTAIGSNVAGAIGTGVAGASTKAGGALANLIAKGAAPAAVTKAGKLGNALTKGLTASATGAASGGAFGAGSADSGERLEGAQEGAAIGAVLSPVATAAGTLIKKGGKALLRAKGEIPNLFSDVAENGAEDTIAFLDLRGKLATEAKSLGDKISKLYKAAETRGNNAFIPSGDVRQGVNVFTSLSKDVADDNAKKTFANAAARIDELSRGGSVSINDLHAMRRANSAISNTGGGSGYAAGKVVRELDQVLDNALDADIVQGDKQAIKLWKNAVDTRRRFGQKFEKPREIAATLGDATIEQIEQKFIGGGSPASARGASRVYDDVLKALPDTQKKEAGHLLRQSVVNKMIKNSAQRTDEADSISGNFLMNQIKNLRTQNKSLWNKFEADEKRILNTLERDLRKEAKGGPVNVAAQALFKFLGKASRSSLELPRTLKPKTILSAEELINLTRIKPETSIGSSLIAPQISGAAAGGISGE